MNYNVRIDDNFLRGDHVDGEVLQHTDLNELESVAKTAINANYEDIQKLQDGTILIGNSEKLNGATLSTYAEETLQNSDTKVPTSAQAKQYIDTAISQIDLSGYYTKREVDDIVEIYDSDGNGIVDNAEKVNNHTVDIDVPANAKFTDTVYDDTEVRNLIGTKQNKLTSSNAGTGINIANEVISASGEIPLLTGTSSNKINLNTLPLGIYKITGSYIIGQVSTTTGEGQTLTVVIDADSSNVNNRYITTIGNGVWTDLVEYSGGSYTRNAIRYVTRDSTETISGRKTFSVLPMSSVVPTSNDHFVNKKYVDDSIRLNSPIKTLQGTRENPVDVRNLDAGVYIIQGYVRYTDSSTATTISQDLYNIAKSESNLFVFSSNSMHIYYKAWDEQDNEYWELSEASSFATESYVDYIITDYYTKNEVDAKVISTLEGTTSNPINAWELEEGIYIIKGTYSYKPNYFRTKLVPEFLRVEVVESGGQTIKMVSNDEFEIDGYAYSNGTWNYLQTIKQYYTKEEIDTMIGDISTALDTINGEEV